jgi:hypothetical protein
MKLYSPIITGSFTTNLNGGIFNVLNGTTSLLYFTAAGNIGVGTTSPIYKVTINGNIGASAYYGDGSNLTGIGSVPFPFTGSARVSGSMVVTGSLFVSGSIFGIDKSFSIDHPTQPGKRLVYGVLEGPEHAVYYRGRIQKEEIELPEEWVELVDESSITVQLTPIKHFQSIYVGEIKDNKVYLKCEDHIDCYYFIQGTRKDIQKLQIIQ